MSPIMEFLGIQFLEYLTEVHVESQPLCDYRKELLFVSQNREVAENRVARGQSGVLNGEGTEMVESATEKLKSARSISSLTGNSSNTTKVG